MVEVFSVVVKFRVRGKVYVKIIARIMIEFRFKFNLG